MKKKTSHFMFAGGVVGNDAYGISVVQQFGLY